MRAAIAAGTARITLSSGRSASALSSNKSSLTRPSAKPSARSRLPKRISAPRRDSNDRAGSTRLSDSPSRASIGRQAAAPRPIVSASTRQNKRADPSAAPVFSAATASGCHKRRNSTLSGRSTAATVSPGAARRSRSASR